MGFSYTNYSALCLLAPAHCLIFVSVVCAVMQQQRNWPGRLGHGSMGVVAVKFNLSINIHDFSILFLSDCHCRYGVMIDCIDAFLKMFKISLLLWLCDGQQSNCCNRKLHEIRD